ncbi:MULTISPECIES: helix-turn-helix domain-containing protein [unclassified Paenibacillus]|uniref:helix-turn-helix domain-containing protein n=1 Tax=unclassified Paenibacillus TaxID=185978 RepID=UPI0009A7FBB4|nr:MULTISPECIES: XRE family transcriptional regulator [unclassified Paenibacillus]SLJ88821.1 transcriptional regulator, XRE family with cupin sensor [Paenibacillus sp. RU5A]SOC61626.1 transcriptional regulator, XRE family with cupin sensor [Paenibacillus sp. RU26A]SOC68433.1 transcriptional regulator, XRE family with cupin sensor [Paenibacillus sp. RU5M]
MEEVDESKQLVLQIGAALKRYRKENNMSLDDLAELTGVSKLTLGNIERGETNPTLAMIWKISKGISLPLMALFKSEDPVSLYRAGEGLRFSNEQKNWVIEPVFKNASSDIEMCRAYLQPNSSYHPEGHHVNTTEIATVMTGSIEIQVNGEIHILNQYDTISFRADSPHSYTNHTNSETVLHIALKYGF